jgi:hypothetical protein
MLGRPVFPKAIGELHRYSCLPRLALFGAIEVALQRGGRVAGIGVPNAD